MADTSVDGVEIRGAVPDDRLSLRRVIDGGYLVLDALTERIAADEVLVAVAPGSSGPVLGAIVFDPKEGGGAHVDAVAVIQSRRDQGIGSALVRAGIERYGTLTAEFSPSVRPFYESLCFEIEETDEADDRLRGRYRTDEQHRADGRHGTD